MSSQQTVEVQAKAKLINLVKAIAPVVEQQLAEFSTHEVTYVLEHFKQHLSYDLARDFEARRTAELKESPFDDLLND